MVERRTMSSRFGTSAWGGFGEWGDVLLLEVGEASREFCESRLASLFGLQESNQWLSSRRREERTSW